MTKLLVNLDLSLRLLRDEQFLQCFDAEECLRLVPDFDTLAAKVYPFVGQVDHELTFVIKLDVVFVDGTCLFSVTVTRMLLVVTFV